MIVSVTVFYLALKNVSRQSFTYYELLTAIVCSSIILTIVNLNSESEIIAGMINCIIMTFFLFYKNKNFINSLMYSALTVILVLSIGNVVTALALYLIGLSYSSLRNHDLFYWVLAVSIFGNAYIVSYAIGKILYKISHSVLIDSKDKATRYILILFTSILTMLLLLFYFNTYMATDTSSIQILMLLNSILMCIMLIFVAALCYAFYRVISQNIEIKHNLELLHNLQEYNISIENLYDEVRYVRHDITNIFSAAYGYIAHDDFDGWKKYFSSEIAPLHNHILEHTKIFNQIRNIYLPEVKGLLAIKFLFAVECNIVIKVEIPDKIEDLSIRAIDLVRLIGILLDNAIHECRKNNGMIMRFVMYKQNRHVKLLVSNQFYGDAPNLYRIYEKNYSTKGEGRGIGLFDMQKILERCDNILLQTYIKSDEFIQEIDIPLS